MATPTLGYRSLVDAYVALRERGFERDEIAGRLGVSRKKVRDLARTAAERASRGVRATPLKRTARMEPATFRRLVRLAADLGTNASGLAEALLEVLAEEPEIVRNLLDLDGEG